MPGRDVGQGQWPGEHRRRPGAGRPAPGRRGDRPQPAAETTPTPPAPPRRRRVGLFVAVALVALALDVVSKVLVVANGCGRGGTRRCACSAAWSTWTQTRNSGAAFSLGTGFTVILTVVALAVVVVIVRAASRLTLGRLGGGARASSSAARWATWATGCSAPPACGRGHVVDWISLFGPYGEYWPIFNLADSAIVCGAVLAAVLALLGVDIDGAQPRRG